MTGKQNLFFQKFGVTPTDLQRYLSEALSAGGDYADLYFEYLTSTNITVDESIVKSATQGISAGCGVRVLAAQPALMIRALCRCVAAMPMNFARSWWSALMARLLRTSSHWRASP